MPLSAVLLIGRYGIEILEFFHFVLDELDRNFAVGVGLSKPDAHLLSPGIDSRHHLYLMVALVRVGLIYADGIDPQGPLLAGAAEILQRERKFLSNPLPKLPPFTLDQHNVVLVVVAPAPGQSLVLLFLLFDNLPVPESVFVHLLLLILLFHGVLLQVIDRLLQFAEFLSLLPRQLLVSCLLLFYMAILQVAPVTFVLFIVAGAFFAAAPTLTSLVLLDPGRDVEILVVFNLHQLAVDLGA